MSNTPTTNRAPVIEVGLLRIDGPARRVTFAGRDVELTKREFELLRTVASEPERVFTKEELLRSVWGSTGMRSRTLDSHAVRIRHKVGTNEIMRNLWGVGYRLCTPGALDEAPPLHAVA